jgi:hypothetical protein
MGFTLLSTFFIVSLKNPLTSVFLEGHLTFLKFLLTWDHPFSPEG